MMGTRFIDLAKCPVFRCPLCGSDNFRTEHPEGEDETGHCKGAWLGGGNYKGCRFTWLRANDDLFFAEPSRGHVDDAGCKLGPK